MADTAWIIIDRDLDVNRGLSRREAICYLDVCSVHIQSDRGILGGLAELQHNTLAHFPLLWQFCMISSSDKGHWN